MNPRALLLALALEATPQGVSRLARFARRKSGYFATLVTDPARYRLVGFLGDESGIDVLWQPIASPRLVTGR